MQALMINQGIPYLEDHPTPIIPPGEALIETLLAGICATDLALLQGYADFTGIPGHEFVGIVRQADNPTWIGQRVVGDINCPCGTCPACRRGSGKHCSQRSALGIRRRHGAMARWFTLPEANLYPVPVGLSDRQAVFAEPLAASLQILNQVAITPSHSVAVLGDGRMGMLIAQAVAQTRCDLVVLGHHPGNWEVLKTKGVSALHEREVAADYSADIVIECTGHPTGFKQARNLVRPGGTLVLKSTYPQEISLDLAALVVDEITLIGSRCGSIPAALQFLAQGLVDVEPLISAEYPLCAGVEAFARAAEPGVLKVLLRP